MATKSPSGKGAAKKKAASVWGSPEYLVARFDDVKSVEQLSRKCVDTRRAKELVKSVSDQSNNLHVYRVYRAETSVPGEPCGRSTIVHLAMGLNGPGRQSSYFEALRRLTADCGFEVFDVNVDVLDDLMDVLCTLAPKGGADPAKAAKPAGQAEAAKPEKPAKKSGKGA